MAVCALLILSGIVLALLPLHIAMTGVCLAALGAVLAAIRLLKKYHKPKIWSWILMILTTICMLVIFVAMGYIAVQGRTDVPEENRPDFVLVLGAQIHGDQPSLTLRYRLDRAAEYLQENPNAVVFVSGGQGPDETQTEASVMSRYLTEKGIDRSRIFEETESGDTRENLIYSERIAEAQSIDTSSVLIVTSEFHLCRAKYYARQLGMEAYGIASPTRPRILMVNYLLREVFAFVKAIWLCRG